MAAASSAGRGRERGALPAASSSASSAERGLCRLRAQARAPPGADTSGGGDARRRGAGGIGAGAPCEACRTLWRRCVPGSVFAPYFTADDFAAMHGVFDASNVSKMLERIELPESQRVAALTLVVEAKAQQRNPTFGRVSYIRILQEVNDKAREQVDAVREEIAKEFGALAAAEPLPVPGVRARAGALPGTGASSAGVGREHERCRLKK
ncbi:LOB domain-containing protein 18-like [Miscanthus floridulus]|uniref:LOB domain-containing protein 18-like n=1 Tax=Miscanthus floridulus TaxID=154761 RepID=UPI003458AB35